MANFLAAFGSGFANTMAEDVQNKRKRRQELVDTYAMKLQERLLSAQSKRASTKRAYTQAYKYAKANGVPAAVVNDVISRNGDIDKLQEELATAADNYRKATQNPEYAQMRYGSTEMDKLFPQDNPEDTPEGLANRYTPEFGEAPVGDPGSAFSTSGGKAFNAAIHRLAKESGMTPEQVAGVIIGAYKSGEVPQVGAPQYTDAEAKMLGGDDKNQSFTKFYKVDPVNGTVDLSSQITINNRELTSEQFDNLRDQGFSPESVVNTMVQQGKLSLIQKAVRGQMEGEAGTGEGARPQMLDPSAGEKPTSVPLTNYTWKDPEAQKFYEENYERLKDDPAFTPENIERYIQAKRKRQQSQ